MREKVRKKLQTLDIERGLGIFDEADYDMSPGTNYLIISYGGTGAKVLDKVKGRINRYVKADQVRDRIDFLVIDTDSDTFMESRIEQINGEEHISRVRKVPVGESLFLDGKAARDLLEVENSPVHQWINPSLITQIKADAGMLVGTGASGTRQIGRVILSARANTTAFKDKVLEKINGLFVAKADRPAPKKVRILILTGISGGTGSGLVVDATYLIHNVLDAHPKGKETDVFGYIMLPPTGSGTNIEAIQSGNRNGVAALKEIDHFMTLQSRKEKYNTVLGDEIVESGKNIFSTCYLIDGVSDVVHENPGDAAASVVADSILDMITSTPLANGGSSGAVQAVDSFLCDVGTDTKSLVSQTSEEKMPREANYVYCALGHGKTLIPTNLLKAYVAKRLFDKMYERFLNCGNVSTEDITRFVRRVKGANGNLRKSITEMLDPIFENRRQGPYYVINLLKGSLDVLRAEKAKIESSFLGLGRGNLEKIDRLINVISALNTETFDVYVFVMEEMKKYLDKEYGIICNSELLQQYGGSTYTFCPINFGETGERSRAVKDYLDGSVVSEENTRELADALLLEMSRKREEWTGLLRNAGDAVHEKFEAAKCIREFWKQGLENMVDATIEGYLVKYYSGEPTLDYPRTGQPDAETDAAMRKAAAEIVEKMWGHGGSAKPFLESAGIIDLDTFKSKKLFLIPKAADNLARYIQAELNNNPQIKDVTVAASLVNDRISAYSIYAGIPLYALTWTKRAEADYEAYLRSHSIGLHMSETRKGEHWARYPSLMVESIWPQIPGGYRNERESKIGQVARTTFERARALGLTELIEKNQTNTGTNTYYYELFTMERKYIPLHELIVNADMAEADAGTNPEAKRLADKALADAVEKIASELYGRKTEREWANMTQKQKTDMRTVLAKTLQIPLESEAMDFGKELMPHSPPGVDKPANWEETLAAKLLRTVPNFMDDLRATVMVVEKLYEKIAKAQAAKEILRSFSCYYVAGLFNVSEDGADWSYWDTLEEEEVSLVRILTIDKVKMQAKHYFAYKAFESRAEAIIKAVQPKFKELIYVEGSPEPDRGKYEALDAAAKAKALEINELRAGKDGIASLRFEKLARDIEYADADIAAIKDFYKKFEEELGVCIVNKVRMEMLAK